MPGIRDLLSQGPQEIVGFLGQEEHPLRCTHVGAAARWDQHSRWGTGAAVVVVVVAGGGESSWFFPRVPYNATTT